MNNLICPSESKSFPVDERMEMGGQKDVGEDEMGEDKDIHAFYGSISLNFWPLL